MSPGAMLRIHFLQQWYALSDPAMEDALYEIESMRRFIGLELNVDAIPDETTILNFRRFLERHALAPKILETSTPIWSRTGYRCAPARWWKRPSFTPRVRLKAARASAPLPHALGSNEIASRPHQTDEKMTANS
jgi:hypothetical protein